MGADTMKQFSVFVVMPFEKSFRDLYELAIKPACTEAGAVCDRVDHQIFLNNILERIYGQIRAADLIVGEMSGRVPNVFYEVGYAHGLGKPVILATKTADDIPFDLRHYPHIIYGDSLTDLKTQLREKVQWCMDNPDQVKGPGEAGRQPELELIATQIKNYLRANRYTKISFERIGAVMHIPEEQARALCRQYPADWRFALLKGNLPGIALLGDAEQRDLA